jgi:hypothetical protein
MVGYYEFGRYLTTVLRGLPVHATNGGTAAEMTKIVEIVLHFMTTRDLRINATGLG